MEQQKSHLKEYAQSPYFNIGHAPHLPPGKDRRLYRFLEMVPGLLSWGTILAIILLSIFAPIAAAIFIIAFDFYWLLKTFSMSIHHRHNWKRLKHNSKADWKELTSHLKYEHLHHMVILPFYNEDDEVVEASLKALAATVYPHGNMIIVLATEERAGQAAQTTAQNMYDKYAGKFGDFIITIHPGDIPGEMPGKGSNIAWAAEDARKRVLDTRNLAYEDVIVSAFDVDTIVWPQYFLCLTWYFLTTEDPHHASFQPVPLYNNNLWSAPALSRVAALSSTFWQMIQQERPEKLTTFSSHSITFKALYEIGYWQKNMVSEDSRIFWNLYLANNGNYRVIPISYPVSMDANLAPTYFQTLKNIYKQHRRWMWGAENIPYILFNFIKNKNIATKEKIRHSLIQLEGFWSLATNPLLILLLGWLPIVLGGSAFRDTVLSYNLPLITRNLMIIAMAGLVLSAIIAMSLTPPLPKGSPRRKTRYVFMVLQWVFVPFTIIIFGALPGLDAQTRLMFGKYMGFWVTPKHRANAVTEKSISPQHAQ